MIVLASGFAAWWDAVVREASNPWEIVLLCGQVMFFSRFIVQWLASEKQRRVTVPVAFWWLSICGATISFVALVAKEEPVLMVAQLLGMVIYTRNLVIHSRNPDGVAAAS